MTAWLVAGGATTFAVSCGLWWHSRRAPRRLGRLVRGKSRADRIAALCGGREPRLVVLASGCAIASAGAWIASGWVAAFVVGAYMGAATLEWRLSHRRRRAERLRHAALDAIGTFAAELRAGLAQPEALPAALVADDADPVVTQVARRVTAAVSLSRTLGAPLADLLERVEQDLRASLRLRALVAAQTSGVRATVALLAGLPIAGTAIGAGLGVSPLDALLHTAFGAACAVGAVALQAAGLAWCAWLSRSTIEAVV
jgi:tight adherence protein B